jgi:hypothetical protein
MYGGLPSAENIKTVVTIKRTSLIGLKFYSTADLTAYDGVFVSNKMSIFSDQTILKVVKSFGNLFDQQFLKM